MKSITDKRSLGEIITDSVKLIFSNIGALTPLLLTVLFLPAFCGIYLYYKLINVFQTSLFMESYPISQFVLIFICFYLVTLHLNLVCVSLIRACEDAGSHKAKTADIIKYFKKLYVRNMIINFILIFIAAVFVGVLVLCANASFAFFFILAAIIGLASYFYLMPLFLYTLRYFLTKDDLSLTQALSKAGEDLADFYGASIGHILVNSMINGVLQNIITLPVSLIILVLTLNFNLYEANTSVLNIITVVQSLLFAIGMSYLSLYFYIATYLKSYDIEERKTGALAIEKIKSIGVKRETFFENEGEF